MKQVTNLNDCLKNSFEKLSISKKIDVWKHFFKQCPNTHIKVFKKDNPQAIGSFPIINIEYNGVVFSFNHLLDWNGNNIVQKDNNYELFDYVDMSQIYDVACELDFIPKILNTTQRIYIDNSTGGFRRIYTDDFRHSHSRMSSDFSLLGTVEVVIYGDEVCLVWKNLEHA